MPVFGSASVSRFGLFCLVFFLLLSIFVILYVAAPQMDPAAPLLQDTLLSLGPVEIQQLQNMVTRTRLMVSSGRQKRGSTV